MWGPPLPPALSEVEGAVQPSRLGSTSPTAGTMPNFAKLTSQSELPAADEAKEFPCPQKTGEKTICIANVNGTYSAMDNVCLHRGGPLGQGMIENGKVVCPWHGWAWDPKTGAAEQNPSAKVAVYPLKIENGDVLVEV
jgi:nitrite reductase (NADH) small subunit